MTKTGKNISKSYCAFKDQNTLITSEGVENPFRAEFLKENGVNVAQGYLFGRPISSGDFITLLKEWDSKNEQKF